MNGADDFSEEESTPEEVSVPEAEAEENFDDILAGIEGITDNEPTEVSAEDSSEAEENFDDILAGIEGLTDDEPAKVEEVIVSPKQTKSNSVEAVIDQSKYPLPVEKEHKVVNQLNEVAEDSEEKASQIFDVLSFILDENAEVEKYNKQMGEFISSQAELLGSLSAKFPNIDIFKENLELANELTNVTKDLANKVNSENNKIFEAMELMQFHDINRQKIERVMAVIRKLSDYLNGIFEDDSDKPEVQIAKHISGDGSSTVDEEDIESLISEFAN